MGADCWFSEEVITDAVGLASLLWDGLAEGIETSDWLWMVGVLVGFVRG